MPLKDRLIRLIETGGPIPLSVYMQRCLHDSQAGYYTTGGGLGRDFTTAPETSQIFGELIGLWCAHEWQALGTPPAFHLAELGPGRGQMMEDILRVAGDGFRSAASLKLVEASPDLRSVQSARLTRHAPQHVSSLSQIDPGTTLILANEYLDCLPVRQFRKQGETWHEVVVGLDEAGALALGLAADQKRPPATPANEAQVCEVQTGLDLLIAELKSRHDAGDRFRALFIDYGTDSQAPGDTLRAYRQGRQIAPLAAPGLSDLTCDVDFGRLRRLAGTAGLSVHGPAPQGMFLLALGAQARLEQLVKANPDQADDIFNAATTLIDPKHMGQRFKVIAISSPGLPAPAGF